MVLFVVSFLCLSVLYSVSCCDCFCIGCHSKPISCFFLNELSDLCHNEVPSEEEAEMEKMGGRAKASHRLAAFLRLAPVVVRIHSQLQLEPNRSWTQLSRRPSSLLSPRFTTNAVVVIICVTCLLWYFTLAAAETSPAAARDEPSWGRVPRVRWRYSSAYFPVAFASLDDNKFSFFSHSYHHHRLFSRCTSVHPSFVTLPPCVSIRAIPLKHTRVATPSLHLYLSPSFLPSYLG